jgi:glutathione S-transferase
MSQKTSDACPLSLKALSRALECRWVRWAGIAVAAAIVGLQTVSVFKSLKRKKLLASFDKKDVVYFLHFPRCLTMNHVSPPCMKLDVFLRLTKIPHVSITTFDSALSPTGRLPCIVYNGEVVCDSEVIINFLLKKQPERCKALLEGLTPEQHVQGTLIRRTAELSLNILGERFFFVDNADVATRHYIQDFKVPPLFAKIFIRNFRRGIIQWLNAHGNGDVPDEQCSIDSVNDVKALEVLLTQHTFAVADRPTLYDASLYGTLNFVLSQARVGSRGALYDYLRQSKPILAYADRMNTALYQDLKEICSDGATTHEFFVSPTSK